MILVINILTSFLAFSFVYNPTKAHKMLIIMINPCFKNIKIIWDFLGDWLQVKLHVMSFLLHVFLHLNLVKASSKQEIVEDDDLFFGQVMLNDDVIIYTLKMNCNYFNNSLATNKD